jgi:rhamnogalacturonyl hydrolase YesR
MRLRAVVPAAGAALSLMLAGAVLTVGNASAGTSAPAAPPTKADILKTVKLVDDYWVKNGGGGKGAPSWQNSTFHVGNLAFVTAGGVSNHVTKPWADNNKYAIPAGGKGPYFPDNLAPGEVYLDLLPFHPETPLGALRRRVADETKQVLGGNVKYVDYVDGLNMALPSFARLGVLDENENELAAMHKLFTYTEKQAGLFDESTGLWWRDHKYVNTKTYWSRGNGWAAMAMAKVAAALPETDPRRAEYVRVLVKMAAKLKAIQGADGFWTADLGAPAKYGPETSGTAFFTYAIAWGINNGVLPAADYRPVVEKAWQGMVSKAVAPSGRLGYVQGAGEKPSDHQPVKATDTAAYGVGGFLLAGSELSKLYG